jgi:GNAT superfamily N-acetyltransferase
MLTSYKTVYKEVAALHATGINEGFLSSLGVGFLTLLYEAIDLSEDAILVVEHGHGRVIGFVSGAPSLVPIYKALLRRPVRLISTLWPVLLSPVKLWRILELVMHTLWSFDKKSQSSSPALPKFELISISVSLDERRSGVARRLYEGLKEASAERGFDAFKILVGDQLDSAHKFYTRMGAVPVSKTAVHGNATSTIYVQEL